MPRITATAGNQQTALDIRRPKFADVWSNYPHKSEPEDVYRTVGGEPYALFLQAPKAYENACALRLSRAFNYGGLTITKQSAGYKVRGADGKIYFLRVEDMLRFVRTNFGKPDIEVDPKDKDLSWDFRHKKGIIIFTVAGWINATGHVTLWNGRDCGDHCYFVHELWQYFRAGPHTTKISFWELK